MATSVASQGKRVIPEDMPPARTAREQITAVPERTHLRWFTRTEQYLVRERKYLLIRESDGKLDEEIKRRLETEFNIAIKKMPWEQNGKLIACAEQYEDGTNAIHVNFYYKVQVGKND